MTQAQYLAALKKLGLSPYGKATRELLGVSQRTAAGFAAGDREIPETAARLLRVLVHFKIDPAKAAEL